MAETSTAGLRGVWFCWGLAVLWLPVYLWSVAQPVGSNAAAVAGAVQGVLMTAIVICHGVLSSGWRSFVIYLLVMAAVTFVLEASSIAAGFPFGYYVHHGAPGPAPLGVPVTVVLGYVVLGWFAWSLSKLIAREIPYKSQGFELYMTPLIGGFVLAGFDYPYDPIGSTVLEMWSFRNPGGQFGVPLSNYLGWIFTGWLAFQLMSLLERRQAPPSAAGRSALWALPIFMWVGIALQYPILYVLAPAGFIELGASRYAIDNIYEASLAASLFAMVAMILVALSRLLTLPGRLKLEAQR